MRWIIMLWGIREEVIHSSEVPEREICQDREEICVWQGMKVLGLGLEGSES